VRLGLTTLAALVAVGIYLGMWSRIIDRMLFLPTPGVDFQPEDYGVESENVFLETEDGVRIHAFFLPAPGATRGLLFLHGNAGNASHRIPNAALLQRMGIHVLLLDYRGYGLSEGSPSEAGVYADARAGLAHLVEARRLPQERIVLFGRSLGGAVAVDLAQDRPLAGLILESTWSTLGDVAVAIYRLPIATLLGDRYASVRKIPRVRTPLLFFHGDRDDIVPQAVGRRLFAAAPEPKAFESLRGAGHNDTVEVGGASYLARIRRFIDEVSPPQL
jgi:fermentation-respiration switch protein FrsA (DUF1100 family)